MKGCRSYARLNNIIDNKKYCVMHYEDLKMTSLISTPLQPPATVNVSIPPCPPVIENKNSLQILTSVMVMTSAPLQTSEPTAYEDLSVNLSESTPVPEKVINWQFQYFRKQ